DGFRALLLECAQDKGTVGYDTDYGYGIVSAQKLVEALQKERTITYERNGGTESQPLPTSYTILRTNPVTLPIATKEGYIFRGWFADSGCTGAALTQIPGGSVGDMTLYAGWMSEAATDTAVISVTAAGVAATVQTDDSFAAVLPYGTVLADLTASQIAVVPHDSLAVVVPPTTADNGATWHFTVAEKPYTLHLTVAAAVAPTIADGQAMQNGSATPASYDGLTAVRPYSAQMGSWFHESGLTWRTVVTGGGGTAGTEGETLTYTPIFADGGKTVTVEVYAQNGAGIESLLPVTVSITVGELPASQSKLTPASTAYDLYAQKDNLSINLQLYGNHLMSVKKHEEVLTAGVDY
ncbi:MAG: InlB B-repeat-containing protein, partial [Oscillospiraceae bacterium]